MKRILVLIALMLTTNSYAAPKKKNDCVQCLTADQIAKRDRDRARIKKEREDLRAENARLREENDALRNRPQAVASQPRAVVTERIENKKNRISFLAGRGPDSVFDRRRESETGNEVGLNEGPIVGASYQRLLGDTISLGGQVLTTVRSDDKFQTYLGSVGVDF